LKYPDDFNTPAFPAGKFVAVSRFMATAIMVVFFLIICLCGLIFWVKKTQDVSPFLISLSPNDERWTVVAHDNHTDEVPAYYVLQESLLNKFARNWFTVSNDDQVNQAIWKNCAEEKHICQGSTGDNADVCAIYCASNIAVFDAFTKVVLPTYSELLTKQNIVWNVVNISIKPVDSVKSVTDTGGMWKLNIAVDDGANIINFIGYAVTAYDAGQHPKTMGYYVANFNTYRMN